MTTLAATPARNRFAALVRTATLATVLLAATATTTSPLHQSPLRAADTAAAYGTSATATVPTDFREFTTWIADDISTYWESVYGVGGAFTRPEIVFFLDPIATPCDDYSTAEEGPYYCNNVVYIPDAWFAADPMRLNDFAVAYVMAHEIGHDVQDTQGILLSRNQGVITSTQTELQADCLAGVWAASAYDRGMLEAGDLEEGITMAHSIGDDVLGLDPEEYTHGSSADRIAWFSYGFETGSGATCVTY